MKNISLLFLCLLYGTIAFGQNYYVAIVHGEVYYNNKRVKKRDKIKMKGNLKFSSDTDYVKLSGAGGLYIIRPNYEYFDKEMVLEYLEFELNASKAFDLEFNMSDSTKIYCIELIWKALHHGNREMKIQEINGHDFCELLTYEKMTKIEIN